MHDRGILFATGTSAGFSFAALMEFLRQLNLGSAIALVGSITSTALAWYITRRTEMTRADIERQHQIRQAARDEDLADALAAIRMHQIKDTAERHRHDWSETPHADPRA
jgi:hypothetical protein